MANYSWFTYLKIGFFYSFVRLRESRESLFIGSNQISHNPYKQEHILGYTIHSQTQKLIVVEEPQQHKIFKTGNISKQQKAFGFSEDRLPHWPLNPLVNHHFPYQMAIIGGISYLGTNPLANSLVLSTTILTVSAPRWGLLGLAGLEHYAR